MHTCLFTFGRLAATHISVPHSLTLRVFGDEQNVIFLESLDADEKYFNDEVSNDSHISKGESFSVKQPDELIDETKKLSTIKQTKYELFLFKEPSVF